jgi:hypothetical protein
MVFTLFGCVLVEKIKNEIKFLLVCMKSLTIEMNEITSVLLKILPVTFQEACSGFRKPPASLQRTLAFESNVPTSAYETIPDRSTTDRNLYH